VRHTPAGYIALRESVAARPVDRDVIEVHGPEAEHFLQGQCSQDVARLAPGGSADALLLNPDGKLAALVRVSRLDGDRFIVDVDGGFGDLVVGRLDRFRLRTKVEIAPLAWACAALRGPAVPAVSPSGGVVLVVPGGTGGFEGLDLFGPDPVAGIPEGVPDASAEAWEARRVESGTPVMGRELDGRTIAAEAGLLDRAVSLTKGCYTGQELVARLDARGNKVARHLRAVLLDDPDAPVVDDGAVLSAADGRPVGAVTSAAFSPALSRVLALGYLHRSIGPGDRVEVGGAGGGAGAGAPGSVVDLPAA
jgi:folate-binding protein YgfZ